jgi:hypothetical protein
MEAPHAQAEPFSGNSEPISVAVSEHVAARRLGVSLDMLRRDRRTGKLGIPFIKLGVGKRGLVRYDLADLERFAETRKWIGRAPAAQARPPVDEPAAGQHEPVEQCSPEPEPTVPLMPARPQTMWDALAERACRDDPPDDPFATGRAVPRRQGSGYWGH